MDVSSSKDCDSATDPLLPMPTESLIAWICDVRRERGKQVGNSALAVTLWNFENQARRQWMRHELTVEHIQKYFARVLALCENFKLRALHAVAWNHMRTLTQVSKRLNSKNTEERRSVLLRLNENLAGRLFDSILMREIIRNPSRKMRENLYVFGKQLWKLHETLPDKDKKQLLHELKISFAHHWILKNTPDLLLNNLADPTRDNWETIEQDFQKYLNSKMYIHTDNGLLPYIYIVAELEHCMEDIYPAYVPWRKDAFSYFEVVKAVRSRAPHSTAKKITKQTGIVFLHQKKLERSDVRNMRPIDHLGGIDIAHLKPPAENALLHGLPFVCGVSAHTMNLLQALAYFRETATPEAFDPKYIFLTYLAHLVDIGAHSIQEASWMLYQLDGPLNLGLHNFWTDYQHQRAKDVNPQAIEQYRMLTRSDDKSTVDKAKEFLIRNAFESNFIIDYEQFFHAFDEDDETKGIIEESLQKSWEFMLNEGGKRA